MDNSRKQLRKGNPSKHSDDEKNPCQKEHEQSLACLSENAYDRDKCSKSFQNYKNCRDFWRNVTQDRERKGIKPYLPLPEDRNAIKKEYRKWMPWA